MPTYSDAPSAFPRPGRVVKVAMSVVTGVTLAFAVGVNWGGVGGGTFELFCGNTLAILQGQVWRLFTAALLQSPKSLWHLVSVLLSLYFFGVALEGQWGKRRFAWFLVGLAVIPAVLQTLFELAVPRFIAAALIPPVWFGGLAVSNGLAVAWALPTGVASSAFSASCRSPRAW